MAIRVKYFFRHEDISDKGCVCGKTHKAEALGCCPKCGAKLSAEDDVE